MSVELDTLDHTLDEGIHEADDKFGARNIAETYPGNNMMKNGMHDSSNDVNYANEDAKVRRSSRVHVDINYKEMVSGKSSADSSSTSCSISDDNSISEDFFGKVNTKSNTVVNSVEINEYDLERERNIQERLSILRSLELNDPMFNIFKETPTSEKKEQRKRRKTQEISTPSITKRSLRSQKNSLLPFDNTTDSFEEPVSENFKDDCLKRKTDEIISMISMEDDEIDKNFLKSVNMTEVTSNDYQNFQNLSFERFCGVLETCKLKMGPTKVTNGRITSLALNDSNQKYVVLTGSVSGNLSVWDIRDDRGYNFNPHAAQVNCLSFSSIDANKFFSTSHDGTVRCADIDKAEFKLLYSSSNNEHENDKLSHLTWHHQYENSLLIAKGSGEVLSLDLRSNKDDLLTFKCHDRSVRTVQFHPTDANYFLTSSGLGEAGIWDRRQISKDKLQPIASLPSSKSLTSAFLSSSGNFIISTCNDDTINIYEFTNMTDIKLTTRINHNNHTGRWLSVFKAMWYPGRDDAFFVGTLIIPKRIQVYERGGKIIKNLMSDSMTTHCPVITAHSSVPLFVGGNSSGRIHVFTPNGDWPS